MRLIDADALILAIREDATKNAPLWIYQTIGEQPTAYDVEKTVENFKEWSFNANIDVGDGTIMNHDLIVEDIAIEIVKAGVKYDD